MKYILIRETRSSLSAHVASLICSGIEYHDTITSVENSIKMDKINEKNSPAVGAIIGHTPKIEYRVYKIEKELNLDIKPITVQKTINETDYDITITEDDNE